METLSFSLWFRGQMLSLPDTADSTNELITTQTSPCNKHTEEWRVDPSNFTQRLDNIKKPVQFEYDNRNAQNVPRTRKTPSLHRLFCARPPLWPMPDTGLS